MEVTCKYSISAIAFLTLFALSPQQVIAQEQVPVVAKHLSTITPPEPIRRIHPKYPVKAAREGRTGWAKFSFIIEKDGSVSNVVELDSSGSKDITRSAFDAIKKWKYQPAMENGQPIQQCVNSVQMDFKMGKNGEDGEAGVRRRFGKKYRLAIEAIKEDKLEQAAEYIEELKKFKYRHASENNYLHTASAMHQEKLGNAKLQLLHLSKIQFSYSGKSVEGHKHAVLHKKFMLAVQLNKFHTAKSAYQALNKLTLKPEYKHAYDQTLAKVDAFIGGQKDFVVQAQIDDKDFWSYELVRNEFSLTDVKGNLNKLDIRCANKRHVYSVEENNTWTIPKAWKGCNIHVYGDDNASFNLVEHPFKT